MLRKPIFVLGDAYNYVQREEIERNIKYNQVSLVESHVMTVMTKRVDDIGYLSSTISIAEGRKEKG